MEDRIEAVLEEVRPLLRMHKGGVTFVSFDAATGVVRVRLEGTCVGCPLSDLTLKGGIEAMLCERIPEVTSVESVSV